MRVSLRELAGSILDCVITDHCWSEFNINELTINVADRVEIIMKRTSTFVAPICVLLLVVPACSPIVKNTGSTEVDLLVPTSEWESDPNVKVNFEKKSRLTSSQGQAILDMAVEEILAEFELNYAGLVKAQQSMHDELHARREQYRRQLNRLDRQTPRFGELMSLNANRSGIKAAISQVEGDIIKVEENLVMLENKRDLNLLAVSWRRLGDIGWLSAG